MGAAPAGSRGCGIQRATRQSGSGRTLQVQRKPARAPAVNAIRAFIAISVNIGNPEGERPTLSPELIGYVNLAGIVAVAAFLWRVDARWQDRFDALNQRMAQLAERVARIEGILIGHPAAPTEPAE